MARSPIIPTSTDDPTGQARRESAAIKEFHRRINGIERDTIALLNRIPVQAVTVNAEYYRFELDEFVLANMNAELARIIDAWLIANGTVQTLWFVTGYINPAYQQGTAQTHTNLSVQSAEYALSRPTLETVLLSPPYQRRIGLVRARAFEEMVGLTDWMKSDLGSTLARGMAAGKNPRVIAKEISARIDVADFRAERIARTEINHALRTARMDEAQDAQERLGIQTKMLHISALSPTTRASHAARNGRLYTVTEQREWWATSPNGIQCKCGATEILVDDNGEPLTPKIVERVRRRTEK